MWIPFYKDNKNIGKPNNCYLKGFHRGQTGQKIKCSADPNVRCQKSIAMWAPGYFQNRHRSFRSHVFPWWAFVSRFESPFDEVMTSKIIPCRENLLIVTKKTSEDHQCISHVCCSVSPSMQSKKTSDDHQCILECLLSFANPSLQNVTKKTSDGSHAPTCIMGIQNTTNMRDAWSSEFLCNNIARPQRTHQFYNGVSTELKRWNCASKATLKGLFGQNLHLGCRVKGWV